MMPKRPFILSDEAVVEFVGLRVEQELLDCEPEDTGHWWDTQTRVEDLAHVNNTSTESFS
jgi:hypothetical protein